MAFDDSHKSIDDIIRMAGFWNAEKSAFLIGGKAHYLTIDDVEKLFGLPAKGMIHDMDSKFERRRDPCLLDRYHIKVKESMQISKLDNALEMTVINQKNDNDIAIWMVIYVLSTFFFANSSSIVTWSIINVAQDLDGLYNYNWPKMILKHLEKGLDKSKENPISLSGCFPLIMYWVVKRTQICERVAARKGYPLIFSHWKLMKLHTELSKLSDEELGEKMQIKNEMVLVRDDTFYYFEESMDAPSSNLWDKISREELMEREKRAKENLVEIIASLQDIVASQ